MEVRRAVGVESPQAPDPFPLITVGQRLFSAAVACLLFGAFMSVSACSDKVDRPSGAADLRVDLADACTNPRRVDVEAAFGRDVKVVDEGGPGVCVFEAEDASVRVGVRVQEVGDQAAFRQLYSDSASSLGLPRTADQEDIPNLGDAAVAVSAKSDQRQVLAVRRGGVALVLEITGGADDARAQAETLARWVVAGLPKRPFDQTDSPKNCVLISRERLAASLGVKDDDIRLEEGAGDLGCQVSVSDRVTLGLTRLRPADPAVLSSLGRVRSSDGVEVTSTPTPVDGLADAVWVAEPADPPTSGEVYFVRGGVLFRVSVSGNGVPIEPLRGSAVAVASAIADASG